MQNSRLCNTKNHGLLLNQVDSKKRAFRSVTHNYKPPVQHGMCSAPKLDDVIEEDEDDYNEVLVDGNNSCSEDNDENTTTNDATFNQIELDDDENEDEDLDTDLDNENERHNDEDGDFFDESSDFNYYNRMGLAEHKSHFASLCADQQLVLSSSSSASSTTSSSMSNSAEASNLVVPSMVAKYMNEGVVPSKKSSEQFNLDNKQFVEVSYDFLSDLSKVIEPRVSTPTESQFRKNVSLSKSFISRNIRPTLHTNLIDPFRRTNISKSFTSFTSRFKPKASEVEHVIEEQESQTSEQTSQENNNKSIKAEIVKVSRGSAQKINDELNKFKNLNMNSVSTSASSLSSPTLSTSSYASGSSSNKNDVNDHQIVISL
jgi:hypothetical protein